MENTKSIEVLTLWEASCLLENVSCKLSSAKSVAELLAEKLVNEVESGAAWALVDMIEVQEKNIEELSSALMDMHRESKSVTTKKGTKK
jgi:hypothetical protein